MWSGSVRGIVTVSRARRFSRHARSSVGGVESVIHPHITHRGTSGRRAEDGMTMDLLAFSNDQKGRKNARQWEGIGGHTKEAPQKEHPVRVTGPTGYITLIFVPLAVKLHGALCANGIPFHASMAPDATNKDHFVFAHRGPCNTPLYAA